MSHLGDAGFSTGRGRLFPGLDTRREGGPISKDNRTGKVADVLR